MSVANLSDQAPSGADIRALRARMAGQVVLPDDPGWDGARQAWNLAVDQRPFAVALVDSADDVVEVVGFARARGLGVAPARRRDRRRGSARPRRGGGRLGRAGRTGGRGGPRRPARLLAGCRRRRLLARRRARLARPQPGPRGEQRHRRRARHRRGPARARRPRARARSLLGPPRRRRKLRCRDRDRARAVPGPRAVRRRPVSGRASARRRCCGPGAPGPTPSPTS